MAKIIQLACELAEVHRRYAEVHSDLFGVSSFRLAINALTGRGRWRYSEYRSTLSGLLQRLADLGTQIADCGASERTSRGAEELQRVMLRYVEALERVIRELSNINDHLAGNEQDYRQADDSGVSPLNRDKAEYARTVSEMEYLGNQLNRLFSTY